MPVLEVQHLVKRFGEARAVEDVSFSVEAGEIVAVMGGSGCGKTTTLRCIAGLEDVTDGAIRLHGAVVASRERFLPPERRGVGMVFQSYALWPHKTALQNVSYGLERRGLPRDEARRRSLRALGQVGLADFAERLPGTLSGGQQQRVAIARCAATSPKLLLLDEPLSNLDASLRERMREELRDMIKMLGVAAVHITHDQAEAMALADRIVCLRDGRVEQIGTPQELYRNPRNRFVADFVGACSFIEAKLVEEADQGFALVELAPSLRIRASCSNARPGERITLALRPEAVQLVDAAHDAEDALPATIRKAVFLGPYTEYRVQLGDAALKAHSALDLKAHSALDLPVGARCKVRIDPSRIFHFSES